MKFNDLQWADAQQQHKDIQRRLREYSCKLKEENTAYFDNLLFLKTYRNIKMLM